MHRECVGLLFAKNHFAIGFRTYTYFQVQSHVGIARRSPAQVKELPPNIPELEVEGLSYSVNDQRQWDELFAAVPPEWKDAPPSEAMKACLKFFLDHGASRILDVGCGVGRWAVYLAKRGMNVKAADFSRNAIDFAIAWGAEENLDIEFACKSITETPFPGEHFDGALAALVLDNISRDEMRSAVSLIRESLVEGGCFFALFNPIMTGEEEEKEAESGNPTAGITSVRYTNDELMNNFPGFQVIRTELYELGTRGYFLIKHTM